MNNWHVDAVGRRLHSFGQPCRNLTVMGLGRPSGGNENDQVRKRKRCRNFKPCSSIPESKTFEPTLNVLYIHTFFPYLDSFKGGLIERWLNMVHV